MVPRSASQRQPLQAPSPQRPPQSQLLCPANPLSSSLEAGTAELCKSRVLSCLHSRRLGSARLLEHRFVKKAPGRETAPSGELARLHPELRLLILLLFEIQVFLERGAGRIH